MHRFYFDINDGRSRTIDEEGQELATAEDARKVAVQELALIMRDEVPDGQRASYVVTVRDEEGVPITVAVAAIFTEHLIP